MFAYRAARSLMLGLVVLLVGCAGASSSALIGKSSPSYTPFFMLDGDQIILEHLRGKNVVVMFWANSCNQSHSVIDKLNEYARKYRASKNLEVIAVSIDKAEDLSRLQDRITYGKLDAIRHSFSGNDIYDQAKIAFEIDSLPSLFVINPQGQVVAGGSSMSVVEQALGN